MKIPIILTTVLLSVCILLSGCFLYNYNNPTDYFGNNYQGYPTVSDISDFSTYYPSEGSSPYFPRFTVSEVLTADLYGIQIALSEEGFDTPYYEDLTSTSTVVDASAANLYEGSWYWRAAAHESGGSWSDWSDTVRFIIVCPIDEYDISPENGALISDTTPELDWTWDYAYSFSSYEVEITSSEEALDGSDTFTTDSSHIYINTPLTAGNTYYWRVRIIDDNGTAGFWNDTFTFTVVYELGATGPAGGLIFYIDEADEFSWVHLEAAPVETEWANIEWGAYGTDITGAEGTEVGTGAQNTDDIIDYLGSGSTYAAQVCDGLDYGGYSDWFLPSRDELALMYENLHLEGDGGFGDYYWSSSEMGGQNYAYRKDFTNGFQAGYFKTDNFRVRAVRTF